MTGNPGRTVHIVDDDAAVRTALAGLLRSAGYDVACHASVGDFMLEDGGTGGCLLVDLQLPGADGPTLQQALGCRNSRLPVIFMSAYHDIPRAVSAMKGGAVDFLTKPLDPASLLAVIGDALARAGGTDGDAEGMPGAVHAGLSERERVVLQGIVAGRINKQIASELALSERTIKSCRADLMRKLGAHSLVDLIRSGTAMFGTRLR